jgi:hypothetical protein
MQAMLISGCTTGISKGTQVRPSGRARLCSWSNKRNGRAAGVYLDLGVKSEIAGRERVVGDINRFIVPRPHPDEAILLHSLQV